MSWSDLYHELLYPEKQRTSQTVLVLHYVASCVILLRRCFPESKLVFWVGVFFVCLFRCFFFPTVAMQKDATDVT